MSSESTDITKIFPKFEKRHFSETRENKKFGKKSNAGPYNNYFILTILSDTTLLLGIGTAAYKLDLT